MIKNATSPDCYISVLVPFIYKYHTAIVIGNGADNTHNSRLDLKSVLKQSLNHTRIVESSQPVASRSVFCISLTNKLHSLPLGYFFQNLTLVN